MVLAGLTVVLVAANAGLSALIHTGSTWVSVTDLVDLLGLSLPFAAVGLLVARRQPRNAIGWTLLAVGLCLLLSNVGQTYSVVDYRLQHGALPLGWLAISLSFLWLPWLMLLALPALLFPAGKLPSPRWRWSLWVYLTAVGSVTVGALVYGALVGIGRHVRILADQSSSTKNLHAVVGDLKAAGFLCVALVFVLWLTWTARLVASYRHQTGDSRQQLKWLMGGAILAVIVLAASIALSPLEASSGSTGGWQLLAEDILPLGLAAIPIGMGVGILKYRLYDIDRIISRTLSYAIVTGLLIGIYIGLVTLATRVLPFSSPLGVAASTLVAVGLFNPLRRRVQRVVDRRFNRARYDAEATVSTFARQVRDDVDLATVSSELVRAVQSSVEPSHVSLWLRTTEPGN
jgi:hypothetical protein